MNYNKKKNLKNHTMHDFFIKNTRQGKKAPQNI